MKPKYKRTSLTLKTNLYEDLEAFAKAKGKSISKVLDKIVDDRLELEFDKAIIRELEKNPRSKDPKDYISLDDLLKFLDKEDQTGSTS
jgi:hypothetical protein